MKLHLGLRAAMLSAPPELPAVCHDGRLYHYASPYVYVTRIADGRVVQRLRYEDVRAVQVYAGRLYVCTSDVYVICLETYDILDIVRLSKALVDALVFAEHDPSGGTFVVSKASHEVLVFEGGRCAAALASRGSCDALFAGPGLYGYVDKEGLVVYRDGGLVLDAPAEELVGVFVAGSGVYSLSRAGVLREWLSGREASLGIEAELLSFAGGVLHVASGYVVGRYSLEGELLESVDVRDEMERYSGRAVRADGRADGLVGERVKKVRLCDSQDDEDDEDDAQDDEDDEDNVQDDEDDEDNVQDDEDDEDDAQDDEDDEDNVQDISSPLCNTQDSDTSSLGHVLDCISPSIIQMDGTRLLLHDGLRIDKMFVFASDITDSLLFEGMLLAATKSGSIVYTSLARYTEGEYLLDGRTIECHRDSITGMARCGSAVLTGSRDGTAVLWDVAVVGGERLELREAGRLAQAVAPIVAVAWGFGIVAVASLDSILQVYRAEGGADGTLALTNILVQKVHARQVNHIAITPRHIVTASSDRTAKVFSHAGEHLKTIGSDKYLHVCFSPEHIALCGHKSIKVLDHALGQVAAFQVRKPVLSGCFYRGMLLGTSDVVRVYDVARGKCVRSYDFGVQNCWSFAFPLLCGDARIAVLADESAAVNARLAEDLRLQREEEMLAGVYCREGSFRRALEIAVKRSDYKKMFRIVCDAYRAEGTLGCLDVFGGCRGKLEEMLLRNAGIKQSEVFNMVLRSEPHLAGSSRLHEICRKHSQAIEDIYVGLLGLDIYE